MTLKEKLRGLKVYLCFNEENGLVHLVNPYTNTWISDLTKRSRDCGEVCRISIKDFLNFIIEKTELLKSRGDLYKVWDVIASSRGEDFKVSSFFSDFSEYYLDEFGEERDFHICERCLGIFLGNLFKLLEE